jgi:hypothetical protein
MTIRGCRWDLAQKSTNPGDDYSVIVTRVRPEDINSGSSLTPDQYFQQTRDSLPSTTPIDGLGDQAFSAGNAVYVLRNHEHLAVLVGLSIPDPVQAATDLARHVLDAE